MNDRYVERGLLFQHTAARRRLVADCYNEILGDRLPFQHTAARRRLAVPKNAWLGVTVVSTHSRPKAAGKL